ncbi:unnamed protein product (macronuclear) [Paramecium tetraurelia]|uniref:Mobilization protein n=1 Tax=Paramecium tetraurelia TaxID=5888 RepID=A0BHI0_PARTE|nr:uncharacterized protein GSPATT00029032001 [Paramecium tetraurelia]CAK57997.1 unnamed protein product [Paramecium tetraurelia]|eukprot:XP_001425395.1 hypothetical protein (macronuclear) [Paramecium tetraurelia strain d4-2]
MNQLYKLTPQELATRKDIVVLSDKGLRFREEIKSQDQFDLDDFHLPQINQQKDKPYTRRQVLQGEKPVELLVADLKKELNISRPYMEKALEKMTVKITSEKPSAAINNKLQKLYQELDKHTRLLEAKKVKFQKKPIEQQKQDQTSILEESEFQDKVASLNALEARIWRMQQNYQNEIRIREDTLKKVKQNLNVMRIQKETEIESVPVPVQVEQLQQSQYLDRKQVRLKDYQKYKFEKGWNRQPPPSYTSKQVLIEEERKKQLQLIKEQQEYEQELLRRNGHSNIHNTANQETHEQ